MHIARRGQTILLIGVFIAAVVLVTVLTVSISSAFLKRPAKASDGCSATGHTNHRVVIRYGKATPHHTVGRLCDTLTIINQDDVERLMAFGLHEHHVAYDGMIERPLGQGQSLTVKLIQPGNFRFHDHAHDEVQGTFTVQN